MLVEHLGRDADRVVRVGPVDQFPASNAAVRRRFQRQHLLPNLSFGSAKGTLFEGMAGDFDAQPGNSGAIFNKWDDDEERNPAIQALSARPSSRSTARRARPKLSIMLSNRSDGLSGLVRSTLRC